MSIITKASTPVKGTPTEFTLNKSNLAQVASILNDPYFSIQDNWKNVIIYYKSSIGNQKQVLNFDATTTSSSSDFLVSIRARDIFQVQKIIVQDFDGGSIVVPRSELNSSEFDVDMGTISPLFTVESGVNDYYNSMNVLYSTTTYSSPPVSASWWSTPVIYSLFAPNPNPALSLYKVRFYISTLNVNGSDFSITVFSNTSGPQVISGTQALQDINDNGYIEYNLPLPSNNEPVYFILNSPNYGSDSIAISKVEFYPA